MGLVSIQRVKDYNSGDEDLNNSRRINKLYDVLTTCEKLHTRNGNEFFERKS